jgi:hypothetical protein
MALILLCSKRLATFGHTEKDQAMRHENGVSHLLLKQVPLHRFERLVEDHRADTRVRRLSTKSQLVALLYGQLSGAASLREIVTGPSHAVRLYHVGAGPVRRSTFSDANAQRPAAVFTDLLALMMKLPVTPDRNILSDHICFLPARQAKNRRNPMQEAVREVRITTDTGKVLRILSNDLDTSAEEIADLYRRRWAIELFFRWVNQILKITRFVGTSDNAVRIQIAVALIAFLLLRMAQALQKAIPSPIVFSRLIRANLMHRRSIDELLKPPPILEDQHQMGLSLC